jgi:hypothetical protein
MRRVGQDQSITDLHDTPRVGCDIGFVRHEDHGHPSLAVELLEQPHDIRARL